MLETFPVHVGRRWLGQVCSQGTWGPCLTKTVLRTRHGQGAAGEPSTAGAQMVAVRVRPLHLSLTGQIPTPRDERRVLSSFAPTGGLGWLAGAGTQLCSPAFALRAKRQQRVSFGHTRPFYDS